MKDASNLAIFYGLNIDEIICVKQIYLGHKTRKAFQRRLWMVQFGNLTTHICAPRGEFLWRGKLTFFFRVSIILLHASVSYDFFYIRKKKVTYTIIIFGLYFQFLKGDWCQEMFV